jgi:hypothetical protein
VVELLGWRLRAVEVEFGHGGGGEALSFRSEAGGRRQVAGGMRQEAGGSREVLLLAIHTFYFLTFILKCETLALAVPRSMLSI